MMHWEPSYTFADCLCEVINSMIESGGAIYTSVVFSPDGTRRINIYPNNEEEEDNEYEK